MPGAPAAPAASRAKNKKHTSVVTASRWNHPAFPHANGFNGFLRALPGESGFVVTIAGGSSRQLDASVEASEPHDFAVRELCRSSYRARPRPSHPAPNVRDDRETPLLQGRDGRNHGCDLGQARREIFFGGGLDR